MNNPLKELRDQKGILIATHRGMVTGNIPHNTFPAFDVALRHGTDIIETDVSLSGDGEVFIFHPNQEKNHLGADVHLEELTSAEIKELRYLNDCRAATEWGLSTLDEFLERYKNRCLINLDHGWKIFPQMMEKVRRHNMQDQILLKCPATLPNLKAVEELAPDMMYMAIMKETDEWTEAIESMNINYVAAELVFAQDNSPLVSPEYIESHHKKGRLLWCNTILYNCKLI
jgi:glycerophosphoryl diester phosphodiesterase